MKVVTIRIPDAHYQRLEALAETEDRTVSWIIRRLIRNGLQASENTLQDSVIARTLGVTLNP